MKRTALLLTGAVAVLGATAPVSTAAPKPKPITKTYTATAPTPDPSHAGVTSGICNTTLPSAQHNEPFTVPFAGTLVIDLSGFQGDWDLALYQGSELVASSAQDSTSVDQVQRPEKITAKLKKAGQKLTIRACNFSGGATATVKYVHTPK